MAPAMFHTNDDFLNAIRAEPHERTLRLVYADWLDEHNDPRGELIRAEEEMRQVPVFADRFWELKPRRNELRTMAGSEWCALMKYGTECEPVFRHGIPDGWRERWRLIREFTERWYRVPMPDTGDRQSEIAEAEMRLGRVLPPSVREWIAFAHGVPPLPSPRILHVLHEMFPINDVPGISAVSLLPPAILTGDSHRAVWHSDLKNPDPPVRAYWSHNEGIDYLLDEDFNPTAETVTQFAFDIFVGVHGLLGYHMHVVDATELMSLLASTFPIQSYIGSRNFYENTDILVSVRPPSWKPALWRERNPRAVNLTVSVPAPAHQESVPAFLWNYINSAGL